MRSALSRLSRLASMSFAGAGLLAACGGGSPSQATQASIEGDDAGAAANSGPSSLGGDDGGAGIALPSPVAAPGSDAGVSVLDAGRPPPVPGTLATTDGTVATGTYCGSNSALSAHISSSWGDPALDNPRNLFRVDSSTSTVTILGYCESACSPASAGKDSCVAPAGAPENGASCYAGRGAYCGHTLGIAARVYPDAPSKPFKEGLFACDASGVISLTTNCDCTVAPPGSPDYCTPFPGSYVPGNDYPWNGLVCGDPPGAWGTCDGQCVSFAAWKIYENMGGGQHPAKIPDSSFVPTDASKCPVAYGWGNAGSWNASAAGAGFAVGHVPRAGDVAQWVVTPGVFSVGHVAMVRSVGADGSIDIEGYNLREDSLYSTLHMASGKSAVDTSNGHGAFTVPWPSNFLHIGD